MNLMRLKNMLMEAREISKMRLAAGFWVELSSWVESCIGFHAQVLVAKIVVFSPSSGVKS